MQIALPVRLHDEASFGNFLPHPGVAPSLAQLRAGLEAPPFGAWLHGPAGCGRTHLLQACCHAAEARGQAFVYLPLAELAGAPPAELLAGLESCALLCLDDIDAVADRPDWEEALFHLYNRVQEQRAVLLMAARLPPASLPVALPDLRSRLQALLVLPLAAPDDDALLAALVLRAHGRGLVLEPEVGRYILARAPRAMPALLALLDRLDAGSLAAGRRLSIPFVRECLGWQA